MYISDDGLDGADQTGLVSGLFKEGLNHVDRGCFSLGSGDTDHLQRIRRITVPCGGDHRHRQTCIFNADNRHRVRHIHRLLYNQRRRFALRCLPCIGVPVGYRAPDTEKQRVLSDLPRIIGDIGNIRILRSGNNRIVKTLQ